MFIGRSGPDHLSFAMSLVAFIISFVPWRYMYIISLMLIGLAILRMFSRNIDQRRKENLAFLRLVNKPKTWYYRNKMRRRQRKIYKVFKCPNCSQKLRVPRGKGKVLIRCTKCGNKLTKVT